MAVESPLVGVMWIVLSCSPILLYLTLVLSNAILKRLSKKRKS